MFEPEKKKEIFEKKKLIFFRSLAASSSIAQQAVTFINTSLADPRYLQFNAHVLAAAACFVAIRRTKVLPYDLEKLCLAIGIETAITIGKTKKKKRKKKLQVTAAVECMNFLIECDEYTEYDKPTTEIEAKFK